MTDSMDWASSVGSLAVREARSWLGTPYVHQASRRGVGCDCLGLIRGVWRALYGSEPLVLPDYTPDWDLASRKDVLLNSAAELLLPEAVPGPGSVLVFRWQRHLPARHLAITSAPGRMIHAYERVGVIESPLGTHWRNRIAGVFRFPEPTRNSIG